MNGDLFDNKIFSIVLLIIDLILLILSVGVPIYLFHIAFTVGNNSAAEAVAWTGFLSLFIFVPLAIVYFSAIIMWIYVFFKEKKVNPENLENFKKTKREMTIARSIMTFAPIIIIILYALRFIIFRF